MKKQSKQILKKEEHKKDTRMTKGMLALYLLLTLGGGVAIVCAMVNIQWVHGNEWRARGLKREASLQVDPARRGVIYSSDGKILATTVTECDLYLDLANGPLLDKKGEAQLDKDGHPMERGPIVDSCFERYLDTVCLMLAGCNPQRSAQEYRERLLADREHGRRCCLVQRGVPYSVWNDICRLPGWKRGVVRRVDGRSVVHQVRAHIYGNLAGNTVGFRNQRELNTYTGLEGAYDSLLRGQDGRFRCRRLTKGIWLPDEPSHRMEVEQVLDDDNVDTVVVQNRVDGLSIVSTIDTRYQDIAESALRKALRQYGGTAGCAILMEMKTGYVLACANLAVDTAQHDYMELRDRNVAVSDVYEPGSTFKTVILAAMMEDPTVRLDTNALYRVGLKDFGGEYGTIRDDHQIKDAEGRLRDSLNLREVMEQSSNVGMAELGRKYYRHRRDSLRLQVEKMFPYANLNPDVAAPQYRSRINKQVSLYDVDFHRFCFGYSTRVTPLQLLTYYNALGAGGRMVKPLFCKAVIDGSRVREVKPVVLNPRMCSKETAERMRRILEGVVERGTGDNIKNNTYGIAGKTGTAYHDYSGVKRYNASFAGFFPSENPRYSCVVMMENVPSYGRQAAVVFKSISDCVVAIDKGLSDGAVRSVWPVLKADSAKASKMPKVVKGRQNDIQQLYKLLKLPYRTANSGSRWVSYHAATDSTAATYAAYDPAEGMVPNCVGMTATEAVALLHQKGYKVKVKGYGRVASQQPRGGTRKSGGQILLVMKTDN